ncbi:WXG100 family type VII secretion target [Stackebrandtia soli]|uniref:WXG100 family type VII secretion target n=1 Tax=Stackebrandtia soli TaxID=1892856 RepID=UPI0039E80F8C
MSGDMIRYNGAGIDDGFGALDSFVNKLDTRLDELEQKAAPIVETWESQVARQAYDDKKKVWNDAADRIRNAIVEVGRALASSKEEMELTDQMASRHFG